MISKQKKIVELAASLGEYQIDWTKIAQQVAEAKLLVENKEPEMKKKNGKKKKGY